MAITIILFAMHYHIVKKTTVLCNAHERSSIIISHQNLINAACLTCVTREIEQIVKALHVMLVGPTPVLDIVKGVFI